MVTHRYLRSWRFMSEGHRVHNEGNPMEYKTPEVTNLGSLSDLTLGMGGSSFDGHGSATVEEN